MFFSYVYKSGSLFDILTDQKSSRVGNGYNFHQLFISLAVLETQHEIESISPKAEKSPASCHQRKCHHWKIISCDNANILDLLSLFFVTETRVARTKTEIKPDKAFKPFTCYPKLKKDILSYILFMDELGACTNGIASRRVCHHSEFIYQDI